MFFMVLIFVNYNNLAFYFDFFYIQSFISGIRPYSLII